MAEGQGSGCWKWAAVGCAVVVLIAVAAGVGVYIFMNKAMEQGKVHMQAEVKRQYEKVAPTLEGDADQKALLDELYAHSQREGLNPTASMTSGITLITVIEDGKISDEEVAVLAEIAGLLRETPNPSFIQVMTWMNSHPELQQRLEAASRSGGQMPPVSPEGPAEVEAPAEEAPEEMPAEPEAEQ